MSHFLGHVQKYETMTLDKPRAAVAVRVESKKALCVVLGIHVAKPDTQWATLPDDVVVMEAELPHRHLKPTKGKKFWVSVATFDPFHMLMEGE